MVHESEIEEQERAKRTAMLRKTELRVADGRQVSARLRNLSETGLGGISDTPLMADQDISVTLDGIGSVPGHIAWVDDTMFGMVFDKAIDPNNLTSNHREIASAPTSYTVPDRFKPVANYKRPGFNNRG